MNIIQMVHALPKAREMGGFSTLLGIGPMSPMLLQATLELSKEQDFPILFIASRNQIDIQEFGGGYVSGWIRSSSARPSRTWPRRSIMTDCTMSAAITAVPGSAMKSAGPRFPRRKPWRAG